MIFLQVKLGQSLGMFFSCPKGLSQWLWSLWRSPPFWADRARLSLERGLCRSKCGCRWLCGCWSECIVFLQCLETDFISSAPNVSTLAEIIFAASEEREKCENMQFWNQVREWLCQLQLELLGYLKQEEETWDSCWKTEAILFPAVYDLGLEYIVFVIVLPAPACLFPVSTVLLWTHTQGSKWVCFPPSLSYPPA